MLEVFFTQLRLNLKSETRKTYLNYLWWILEPALFTLVFYLVFAVFLNRGTEGFLLFLLCGKIPFLWFSKSVTNSSNAIFAGKGLIHQIAIPKAYFPLMVVAQDFVKQVFVFIFLLLFLIYMGANPSTIWIYFILILFVQLTLVIACSLVSAAITPFIPDFKFLISTAMMMLMFCSGIFYSYEEVLLDKHQNLFLLNPVANLIKNYRQVLLENQPPDFTALSYMFLGSVFVIIIMKYWYKKTESTYARLVIQ